MYLKLGLQNNQMGLSLGHVDYHMFRQLVFPCESFATFVALERSQPRARPHVALLCIGFSTSIIALVTLEWLFSCVLRHHVNFQFTSLNEGRLASCASVRLFPRVGHFVPLQIAWLNCSIIALVAFVRLFPRVGPCVLLQMA